MKTYLVSLLFVFGTFISNKANSQVSVNLNVNVGMQPAWGPVGYDLVEYYYLPDVEMYYFVPRRQFVYMVSGRWIFATSLPARCRGYDLYGGYKVVINEPHPYRRNDYYRSRYGRYKGWHGKQKTIYAKGYKEGHGNGQGKGHSKHH
ncbi:hypothetical protein [Flavihumibacter fluvii]|uniref:hypothetical protein n=1 Tax=Flavihumibacter fluvii TaxID=2838157 RepID=UPI001BDEF874|nr:hypothetical protein [Flavihumibacter fluvii]ULQ54600.1 hypothetical protein KJS93_09735 [Flavihumibacter fluvii]